MNLLNLDHQMKSRRSPQLRRNDTLEVNELFEVRQVLAAVTDGRWGRIFDLQACGTHE